MPSTPSKPRRFSTVSGSLPEPGVLPDATDGPFETVSPTREGYLDRDGVQIWYAQWGETGPWLVFAPPFQMVHAEMLKATVPYLSQYCRVITTDARGNGRSGRPEGQEAYSFDLFYGDLVAVLDALRVERVAVVGISLGAMLMLRLAADQPERVTHAIAVGGFAETLIELDAVIRRVQKDTDLLESDWLGYIDDFVAQIFSEPHSTKPYEDGVHYGWATTARTISGSGRHGSIRTCATAPGACAARRS